MQQGLITPNNKILKMASVSEIPKTKKTRVERKKKYYLKKNRTQILYERNVHSVQETHSETGFKRSLVLLFHN